jgi:hypothetical protein
VRQVKFGWAIIAFLSYLAGFWHGRISMRAHCMREFQAGLARKIEIWNNSVRRRDEER